MPFWPFSKDNETEEPQLPGSRLVATSPKEYSVMLKRVADELPWLGTPPFELIHTKRTPRGRQQSDGFKRRVLVSMLVGRPMSEVARRVKCSVRTVYNVLYETILTPRTHAPMTEWTRLGLLAIVDGPDVNYVGRNLTRISPANNEELPVVCLMCHRSVGRVGYPEDRSGYDGSLVLPYGDSWDRQLGWSYVGQGHLVCHFALGADPIRLTHSHKFEMFARIMGFQDLIETGRQADLDAVRRNHWTEGLAEEEYPEYEKWIASGSPPLTPVRNGRKLRVEEAEHFWQTILDGGAV